MGSYLLRRLLIAIPSLLGISVVLFAVLPWGIRRSEAPQPGHAVEAPSNPRIALRFAVTTVIATALFILTWLLIASDLITFREP